MVLAVCFFVAVMQGCIVGGYLRLLSCVLTLFDSVPRDMLCGCVLCFSWTLTQGLHMTLAFSPLGGCRFVLFSLFSGEFWCFFLVVLMCQWPAPFCIAACFEVYIGLRRDLPSRVVLFTCF